MNLPKPDATAAQLIAQYGPQRSGPYVKLRPHAGFIAELRSNQASYDTIVAILRERDGIEVSNTTVRHFCREVLREPPPKRRGRRPAQSAPPAATAAGPPFPSRPAPKPKLDGPQIAEVDFIDEPKPNT
jgi:hypothetical protein